MNKFFMKFILLLNVTIVQNVMGGETRYFMNGETQYGASCITININKNDSSLVQAIKLKDLKKVEFLIKSGSDVNEVDAFGNTPLIYASFVSEIGIMQLLVEAGADLTAYNNNGDTALMAILYVDSSTNDSLITSDKKTKAFEYLLSKKVDIEVMNNNQRTPLILAALNNNHEVVKQLISAKAKTETKGNLGRSAFMHATENGSMNVVRIFLDNKIDIDERDCYGFTPLMLAAVNDRGNIIRILLKSGADKNACTVNDIPVADRNSIWSSYSYLNSKQTIIPKGSTALDIAKQFNCRTAEYYLVK